MQSILQQSIADLSALLPGLATLEPALLRIGTAMLKCWSERGKVLTAGNGGSAADAIHFAEELVVRFQKTRRGLAAIALCDPGVVTCAANDFGYDQIFSRQVEALGNPGDIFIALSTSGNSPNVVRALKAAREQHMVTVGFLGRDGGQAKEWCDIPLVIPHSSTARIQEAHKLLYHCLCEWIEARVE